MLLQGPPGARRGRPGRRAAAERALRAARAGRATAPRAALHRREHRRRRCDGRRPPAPGRRRDVRRQARRQGPLRAVRAGGRRDAIARRRATTTRRRRAGSCAPSSSARRCSRSWRVPPTPALAPVIDLRTGDLAGHEALAHFAAADERPPAAWLAQARRCGLGPRLEAEVLRGALAVRGRPERHVPLPERARLRPGVRRSCRPSSPAISAASCSSSTRRRCSPPARASTRAIARLRNRGARLAVDRAGAGYAALRMLMRLRPDIVKLDRGLVEALAEDGAAQTLVESFVRLAHAASMRTCRADGVDDVEDLRALTRLDVRYAQGRAVGPAAARAGRSRRGRRCAPPAAAVRSPRRAAAARLPRRRRQRRGLLPDGRR